MESNTSSDISRRRTRSGAPASPGAGKAGSFSVKVNDVTLGHWRHLGSAMFVLAAVGIALVPIIDRSITIDPGWVLYAGIGVCAACAVIFQVIDLDSLTPKGRLMLLLGVLTITALIATSAPVTSFSIFYFWPLLAGAYVFSRTEFFVLNLVTIALHAAALGVQNLTFGGPFPLLSYLMWVLGMSTVMVAVWLLREGIDKLMHRLEVISSTDALTGIANRRTFEHAFALASERATKEATPLSVLLFDLDHFKQINDTYGHKGGDAVLERFAGLLRATCRADDVPARIGGEEFALIMHGTGAESASSFGARFAEVLRTSNRELPEGEPPVTVSIGVAELNAHVSCSETLFVEADRALYEAKRAGRDRVVVANGRGEMQPVAG